MSYEGYPPPQHNSRENLEDINQPERGDLTGSDLELIGGEAVEDLIKNPPDPAVARSIEKQAQQPKAEVHFNARAQLPTGLQKYGLKAVAAIAMIGSGALYEIKREFDASVDQARTYTQERLINTTQELSDKDTLILAEWLLKHPDVKQMKLDII